jgi:pyridoxine 5'-phosphate synthase PdxJ
MRARPDHRHLTLQDIKELREFINARPAQEFADMGYAAVAATCWFPSCSAHL